MVKVNETVELTHKLDGVTGPDDTEVLLFFDRLGKSISFKCNGRDCWSRRPKELHTLLSEISELPMCAMCRKFIGLPMEYRSIFIRLVAGAFGIQQSILIFKVPTDRFTRNISTTLTIYKHSAYGL